MKAEVRKIVALWRLKQLKSGGSEEVELQPQPEQTLEFLCYYIMLLT